MARTVLEVFFKKFRDSIQSNKQFRDELNKQTNHYLEEDIKNLVSQISTVNAKAEMQFTKKYGQALEALISKGMSDTTFNRIQNTLKKTFLDHFKELKEIGIDVGHVSANLTIASKGKAQTEAFQQDVSLSRNNLDALSDNDVQDIAKTVALMATYTTTLEELDNVQNRSQLLKFLKKSGSFKQISKDSDVTTIEGIQQVIEKSFAYKGSKGYNDLGRELLSDAILNVEFETVFEAKRKITATGDKVAVTFEIAAFNRFKGTVAKAIQANFTQYLDTLMKDPNGLPKHLNKALEAAIKTTVSSSDIEELFPNVSGSKTAVEAITDVITDMLITGKAKNYSAQKSLPNASLESQKVKVKIPEIKISTPKVTSIPIAQRKKAPTYSLARLQLLLDSNLQDIVSANMGMGTERGILNYQTGRFAASVKVERLSESRQGMITAFYTYMKNPYQTFEPGFRQGSPKSRDPKLLISKSIRELAATMVGNRLRAVQV